MSCVAQIATQVIGLSPSGKATDSDSVISKVRILLAQLIKTSVSRRYWGFLLYFRAFQEFLTDKSSID